MSPHQKAQLETDRKLLAAEFRLLDIAAGFSALAVVLLLARILS